MGQKSTTETVVAIVQAFLVQRTWHQAKLAHHVDVGVPALRKRIHELEAQGFPFTRDTESPTDIYWSLPKDWFPGGVTFPSDKVPELLRLLGHLPRGASRDRLIEHIITTAPRQTEKIQAAAPAVVSPPVTEIEETYMPLAESALEQKASLYLYYLTASRGSAEWRHASIQRIVVGSPTRLIVVCHRDGKLKWFRLENVLKGRLDPAVPYREADETEVKTMMAESMDGFHQGSSVRCSFVVLDPESRWVSKNLLPSMAAEPVPGGIRVTTTTAGLLRLARYVVGLGGAARVETPELAALVRELARGALGDGG